MQKKLLITSMQRARKSASSKFTFTDLGPTSTSSTLCLRQLRRLLYLTERKSLADSVNLYSSTWLLQSEELNLKTASSAEADTVLVPRTYSLAMYLQYMKTYGRMNLRKNSHFPSSTTLQTFPSTVPKIRMLLLREQRLVNSGVLVLTVRLVQTRTLLKSSVTILT